MSITIVWFRQDLRLADHPALVAAVKRGGAVLPVFIWSPDEDDPWQPGGAARWWLHQSLDSLTRQLEKRGSRLVLRAGPSLTTLRELIRETGATAVYWSRRYDPASIRGDSAAKEKLKADGIEVKSFNASLLFEPWEIRTQEDKPYKVFTPFWKQCLAADEIAESLPIPARLPPPPSWPHSLGVRDLRLEPDVDWAGGIRRAWAPGEKGAADELDRFLDGALAGYAENRDRPDTRGTSQLSPSLHFGEISPRTLWHAIHAHAMLESEQGLQRGAEAYLRELGWREFAHHLLYHFPHTTLEPLREEFKQFPWAQDARLLRAWQKGRTGYPIVDAGMRQLWETGWMHNRVRMITASFLIKDLHLHWLDGAKWFWDTLVDADLANNTLGWQWTAGCGADAAPFFRIFNPVSQGRKFDPDGEYVKRFVPELANLPAAYIHQPWAAPSDVLAEAEVELGKEYPEPIVDHAAERDRALEAYATITKGG